MQCAEHDKDVFRFLTEHNSCAVNGKQIAEIELSYELNTYFTAVYLKIHALEMTLQQTSFEVGHCACGIGLHRGFGILHHHHSVLVVGVGYGESRLGQTVEESLLGVAVVLESLMIIEMVACKVCEYTSGEMQSADTFLCYGVRAALHERIFTSGLNHACQQSIELYRVGRGMVGRYLLVYDIVADS